MSDNKLREAAGKIFHENFYPETNTDFEASGIPMSNVDPVKKLAVKCMLEFHKEQSTQSESETTDSLLKRAAFLVFLARVDSTLKDCQPVYEKYTKNYDRVQKQIEKILSDIPKFLEEPPVMTSETELSGKMKEAEEIYWHTNDDGKSFKTIEEAEQFICHYESEMEYFLVGEKRFMAPILKSNAWQPNGEYSFFFGKLTEVDEEGNSLTQNK